MSKCDIRIDFDKPDRTYHGGEQVTGKVRISVNQDIQCNGIVLTHYWKTHGRGNTDQGPKTKIQLSELVPLQAGENLTLPFEFKADLWPLTYHGNYINVDHYVHVGIDVPWAIDPKQEEDYILVAGERPPQFTGKRDELIEIARPATEVSGIIKLFLYGILAIFAVVLSTLFFFLIPVFAFIGIGFWIWQKMIASRVGNVVIKTPHVVVGPGEQWPVELAFTARKTFPVNGITARIFGQESATSGSGTNSTTHTHTLYDETHVLHPEVAFMAGEEFSGQFAITFPNTCAWNLKEGSNKINWWAEVRIDIPRFPDWKKKTELQIVPLEFLNDTEASTIAANTHRLQPYVIPGNQDGKGPQADFSTQQTFQKSATDSFQNVASLLALVQEIKQTGRFGNQRSEILQAANDHTYEVCIVIDRISPTFGFPDDDDRYKTGKTVVGKIAETEQEVQLYSVNESNRDLEDLCRGETWQTQAKVDSWDSLYKRLVMREVSNPENSDD